MQNFIQLKVSSFLNSFYLEGNIITLGVLFSFLIQEMRPAVHKHTRAHSDVKYFFQE